MSSRTPLLLPIAGRGVRAEIGEYRGVVRVPRRGSNADCRNGPLSAASRRTTSSGPGSRASLSGSCAGVAEY